MDLNHIGLSPELVAELYKNHIVEIEHVDRSLQAGTSIVDTNKVAVIVQYPDSEIPAPSVRFLQNLLSAASVKMSEVDILNITQRRYEMDAKGPKTVFLFGVSPVSIDLPINFPEYQVQTFNGVTYLCAPKLEDLEHDKLSKSKLWVCLKRIFNL